MTDGVLFLKATPPSKVAWPAGTKLVGLDPASLGFTCGGADPYCSTAYANFYASFKDGSGRAVPNIRKKYGIDGKLVIVSYSAGLGFTSPLLNNDADRADVAGVVLMDSTFGTGYSGYVKAAKDAAAGKLTVVSVTSDKGSTDSHMNGDYAFREAVLKPAGLIDMPSASAVAPMPAPGEGVFRQGSLWYYRYKDAEYPHQALGKLLVPVSEAHVLPILSGAGAVVSSGGVSPVLVVGGLAALVGGIYAWQRVRLQENPLSELWAVSKERYRASAAEKRLHGGSTVTVFYVGKKGDERDASKWIEQRGYGPTPGDRKTDAMRRAAPRLGVTP